MKHRFCTEIISRGTFLSLGSPWIADMASQSGFDWVLIDCEHGLFTEATLQATLLTLRSSRTLAIVRVASPDDTHAIARALDWGADGVMIPQIETAEQARRAISAARHLPDGNRGYSRSVPRFIYGLQTSEETAPPIVMLQIETLGAAMEIDAIAAIEGGDVLFIGPADMQRALRYSTGNVNLVYEDILRKVTHAAATLHKKTGILIRDPDSVTDLRSLGFTVLAIHSDTNLLRDAFADSFKTLSQSGDGSVH